jgi:opacity protein-like surface antigen
MKKVLAASVVAAGLLGASTVAMAQDSAGRMYAGISLGQAELKGFCSDVQGIAASVGGSVASCDEKDSMFKFFLGYRVNRNFAIEGSYIDYGDASATGQSFGVPFRVSADATAFGVAALGIIPLGERFSLFGKFGLLFSDGGATASGAGGSFSDSGSDTGLHLGVGAMFDITRNFGVRAEWERNDELEVDTMSIGLQVRF